MSVASYLKTYNAGCMDVTALENPVLDGRSGYFNRSTFLGAARTKCIHDHTT
jgi:hypothetical protein